MSASLLVVTPTPSLGDMLRKSLEQSGSYTVHVARNRSEAVVRADEESSEMVFLDLELGEKNVTEIAKSLRTIKPTINLFVLCGDETPPALDAIRPWALVRKPFHITEIIKMIKNPQENQVLPVADLAWLGDASKAAQQLTRITLGSSAQAALITRNNELWAYAGGLSQEAAKEVAQTVSRTWDSQKGSDLLRFIRLESTRAEHMLYATFLLEGTILALVFDAETPFSTIRSQASKLMTSLEPTAEPQQSAPAVKKPTPQFVVAAKDQYEDDDENDDLEIPHITDILKDIPIPNPSASSSSSSLIRSQTASLPADGETRQAPSLSRATVFSREQSPAVRLTSNPANVNNPAEEPEISINGIDVTAPAPPKQRPLTPLATPKEGEQAETRPTPTTEAKRSLKLEPVTAGLYHLAYACLLVPRFVSHAIVGDLANYISDWMPNICVAFGWRLEHLAVRPEYVQWVVNVQPNTSPGHLMRIMRQQTSEKIFAEIARFKKENPSGDFWAPGYLIMGGNQPHPAQLVKDYIRETRERQGIENPRR